MNAESSPEYKTINRESKKDLEQSDEQPKSYLNDIELNIISNMRFPQELPRSRYLELRNQYSVDHRDYPLNYNQRTGRDEIGNCYDIDSLLTKYVSSTRDLIYQMDGRLKQTYTNGSGESIDENAPDDVIYLDKSARPVEWMVRKFWSVMAQDGTVQPKSHFVNIDRVDWLLSQPDNAGKLISDLNHNDFKKEQVSAEDIARIRSIFVEGKLTPENWQQEVWQMPTVLDGRKVLIVDEVSSTGATIKIAKDLIQLACPETFVNTSVFWYPEYKVLTIWNERDQKYDNEWQMGQPPIWYHKSRITGRGVGDKSEAYYEEEYLKNPNDRTFKAKLGSIALSAPLLNNEGKPIRDRLATDILKEIRCMVRDYKNSRILEGNPRINFPDDQTADEFLDDIARRYKFKDRYEFQAYLRLREIETELKY